MNIPRYLGDEEFKSACSTYYVCHLHYDSIGITQWLMDELKQVDFFGNYLLQIYNNMT